MKTATQTTLALGVTSVLLALMVAGCQCPSRSKADARGGVYRAEVKQIDEPKFLCVPPGSPATITARVGGPGSTYQWFRDGEPLPGQTQSVLSLPAVTDNDVGLYECEVSGAMKRIPFGAMVREKVALTTYLTSTNIPPLPVIVTAKPIAISGVQSCCSAYLGRVSYAKGAWPNWGWTMRAGQQVYKACAADRTACVVYTSSTGRTGCGTGCVSIPYRSTSEQFRFAIYFKSSVPSTCALTLTGFNP